MNDSLKKLKADMSRDSDKRFVSQEEMYRLIAMRSAVDAMTVRMVLSALQNIIVERFSEDKDVLLPGIMRIIPGAGGLTRRYIKIQSISEKLKGRLR